MHFITPCTRDNTRRMRVVCVTSGVSDNRTSSVLTQTCSCCIQNLLHSSNASSHSQCFLFVWNSLKIDWQNRTLRFHSSNPRYGIERVTWRTRDVNTQHVLTRVFRHLSLLFLILLWISCSRRRVCLESIKHPLFASVASVIFEIETSFEAFKSSRSFENT